MMYKKVLVTVFVGLALIAAVDCQPKTYSVQILNISQPEGRSPVATGITLIGGRYATFSGAPILVEFAASGFHCPTQDMSFMISYMYRRVRPDNFLEDPSLFVMEGHMLTTTVISDSCMASWTSPVMRDGIHTIGILAFDGAGAQSPWYYITIVKNNERDGSISHFPGGDDTPAIKLEEAPVSREPAVIIETPSQTLRTSQSPVQYVDIHFYTTYPFQVEYFYVEWTFISQSECTYSSYAIVYPTEYNRGVYRLDMSSVFASEWDKPIEIDGRCAFGTGEFIVKISAKTAQGLGDASTVIISLS